MERSLIIIKPDAVQRGLVGEITKRFENKGLKLVGCKMMQLDDAILKEHYAHLIDKPFFPGISSFMQSTPVIVQCWEGYEAVESMRIIVGITKARGADAGTVRGDLAMSFQCNVVHASDSSENAEIEVKRFFKEGEIFEYNKTDFEHVYAGDEK